jgi:NADH:ubiquinone oxidoreductase subunit 5 (subunit L)/multisubunit Na+/H+ antiporter MnhA subunit
MSGILWALLAVPLIVGGLLCVVGRRANRLAAPVGVAAGAVTLALAAVAAATRPAATAPLLAGVQAGVRVDGLSAVMVVTVTAVTLAVLMFATAQADLADGRGRFVGLMLLFAGAMLVTVTATTLPLLLMGWETMGAASWALIGFWWRQPQRVRAANTAFLTTRAADLGLYLAAGAALAGGVASLRLDALPRAASPWLSILTAGVLLAGLGKSAQLPFSFWLSKAMEGPSPVSALLHSATMVAAGAYLLLRLHPVLAASGWAGPTVGWVGALTALLLGLVALAQTDLKQLLAASTCAQIGFMVLAAGAGAITAGTGHLVAHAATKSLLFLAAGAWLTTLGTQQLPALRGAARRYRLVGAAFTAGILSLAGLAPLSLWATKDEILTAALATSPALYAVGFAAAIMSTAYSIKALWYVLRPAPPEVGAGHDCERLSTGHVPAMAAAALIPLAVAAVVLGALALPGPSSMLRRAVGVGAEPSPVAWQLAASAAAALVVAALTWWWGGRRLPLPAALTGWLGRWLDLERLAHLLLVRPALTVARSLAGFDDRIIDGAVHQVTRAGLRLAWIVARADDVAVDGLVTALAAGVRRLGRLARRPQTGLVHQYYAQAALALAVLAVLLLVVS